jgi:hypothetical protein
MIVEFSPDRVIRGRTAAEDFHVSIQPVAITDGGTTTPGTNKDWNYLNTVAAGVDTGLTVSCDYPAQISTDTPELGSFVGDTFVPDASGNAGVIVATKIGTRRYSYPVVEGQQQTYKEPVGYTAGSLARHIHDAIAAMVAGKTPGAGSQELFTAASYTTPSATRNANLFCGSLDLSAISFTRSDRTDFVFPVVLVTPRHVLFSWHVGLNLAGKTLTFMRPNGTFQTVAVQGNPVQVSGPIDCGVAFLATAVTGITPMATLPADWAEYFPLLDAGQQSWSTRNGAQYPVLMRTAHTPQGAVSNRVCVLQSSQQGDFSFVNNNTGQGWWPLLSQYQPWHSRIIGGASGSPTFAPINDEAVLLGLQYGANAPAYTVGVATQVSMYRPQINTALNTVAGAAPGTYAMRTVDLSSFTNFAA